MEETQKAYLKFVVERLKKYGSMPIQSLTGHLSQLPCNVRDSCGTSKHDLLKFCKQHASVFDVDNKGFVQLNESGKQEQTLLSGKETDGNCGNETISDLPLEINGKGRILRLFPQFGFIKVTKPFNTSVYFTAAQFSDKRNILLQDCGVKEGDTLIFSAKRGPPGCEAKYRATNVRLEEASNCVEFKSSAPQRRQFGTNINNGLFDPLQCSGEGEIQKVLSKSGFIMIEGNPKNTIYFRAENICNYENITNLTTVLTVGDKVEYDAIRSTKTDSSARWEATKVWIKTTSKNEVYDLGDEIFESNSENSACNSGDEASTDKVKENRISNKVIEEVLQQNCRKVTDTLLTKNSVQLCKSDTNSTKLSNVSGKIYTRGNTDAVIKFGVNDQKLASVKSNKVFVYGSPVTELSWEVQDGQQVHFDAVEIGKWPKWEAVLAWIGDKPEVSLGYASSKMINTDGPVTYQSKRKISVKDSNNEHLTKNNVMYETVGDTYKKNENLKVEVNTDVSPTRYTDWGDSPFLDTLDVIQTNEGEIENLCDNVYNSSESLQVVHSIDSCDDFETKRNIECGSESKEILMDNSKGDTKQYEISNVSPNEKNKVKLERKNDSNKIEEQESKPGIYSFCDLCGTIKSLYNIYGEFYSPQLRKPLVFCMKDFYIDSKKCKDIKSALKVNESIFISGFEIIDDSNYLWQKATLVWKGEKPKGITEMSPAEFIMQQKLVVSLNYVNNDVPVEGDEISVNSNCVPEIESDSERSLSSSISSNNLTDYNEADALKFPSMAGESSVLSSDLPFPNTNSPRKHSKSIKKVEDFLMNYYDKRKIFKINKEETKELSSKIVELLLEEKQSYRDLYCGKPKTNEMGVNFDGSSTVLDSGMESSTLEPSSLRCLPKMCSVGVQTFCTGDILSIEIYPH